MNTKSRVKNSKTSCISLKHIENYLVIVFTILTIIFLLIVPMNVSAQDSTNYLKKLSLEDLVNLEVTSVSKKPEKVSKAAAAIYVLTGDDILKSGFNSIPEALRLVPGLHVARIDGNKWAITARGFNGNFANKLLVLIDGRSIYTPLFSGVYWDIQDVMMEDIERIEVIRGPGATLWGANAVNGVINIITKNASETVGGLVKVNYETGGRSNDAIRYGFPLSEKTNMRVFARYNYHNGFDLADETTRLDHLRIGHAGFRMDWSNSNDDKFFLRSDYYEGTSDQLYSKSILLPPYTEQVTDTTELRGGSVTGRWIKKVSPTSEFAAQFYIDYTNREDSYAGEKRTNIDFDLQYRFELSDRIGIIAGLGYRYTKDETDSLAGVTFIPPDTNNALYSTFVQTDISVIPNRLRFTLGSKFEKNDYTGEEIQPSGRLLWTPHEKHVLWAAISSAVRTPSRAENSLRLNAFVLPPNPLDPLQLPTLLRFEGDNSFKSEKLTSYEFGYKHQPRPNLSVDIASFYNKYTNLRSLSINPIPIIVGLPPEYILVGLNIRNDTEANTYGLEFGLDWILSNLVKINASYTYFQFDITKENNIPFTTGLLEQEGTDPKHKFVLQLSSTELIDGVNIDANVRYVDKSKAYQIESYLTTDLRVGYNVNQKLKFIIGGLNLTGASHSEYPFELNTVLSSIDRSFYSTLIWSF